jgi:hypothetical protein
MITEIRNTPTTVVPLATKHGSSALNDTGNAGGINIPVAGKKPTVEIKGSSSVGELIAQEFSRGFGRLQYSNQYGLVVQNTSILADIALDLFNKINDGEGGSKDNKINLRNLNKVLENPDSFIAEYRQSTKQYATQTNGEKYMYGQVKKALEELATISKKTDSTTTLTEKELKEGYNRLDSSFFKEHGWNQDAINFQNGVNGITGKAFKFQ